MIHTSLQELLKAMKGLVVLSQALEEMSKSLFNNSVPVMWSKAVCFYFSEFLFLLKKLKINHLGLSKFKTPCIMGN